MKKVRYNGGTDHMYWCNEPDVLKKGQTYEMLYEHQDTWQTNWVLKGIHGEFNSAWFDLVSETKSPRVFICTAMENPVVGKRFYCCCLETNCGETKFYATYTSSVVSAKILGENIWEVKTKSGATYIAAVG